MGSIADLLGDQLRAGLAQLTGDPGEGKGDEDRRDQGGDSDSPRPGCAQDHAREVAMESVLDECELDPSQARAELTLRGDLDMDDVSLYAVVARIEREAKVRLPDASVDAWVNLGDLLDAVCQAASHD